MAAFDANESLTPFREGLGYGAILFDRPQLRQAGLQDADPAWFDPTHWGERAHAVGSGGRGAAWFVDGPCGGAVLRHYRRGGLVGRVNHDRYLWRGEEGTRSFREFRLLATLRARGFDVPAPIAAGYERHGAFYRADLLTARIPQARTLAESIAQSWPAPATWHAIGATLARFHAGGVWHADLNAHNVMLDGQARVWLIDFDRGELRPPRQDWARANLARLLRSLRKLGATHAPGWHEAWEALQFGYFGADGARR